MPADDAPETGRSGSIRTPDQLQQSKRPDAPEPGAEGRPPGEASEPASRTGGVLGQLETERAHD